MGGKSFVVSGVESWGFSWKLSGDDDSIGATAHRAGKGRKPFAIVAGNRHFDPFLDDERNFRLCLA